MLGESSPQREIEWIMNIEIKWLIWINFKCIGCRMRLTTKTVIVLTVFFFVLPKLRNLIRIRFLPPPRFNGFIYYLFALIIGHCDEVKPVWMEQQCSFCLLFIAFLGVLGEFHRWTMLMNSRSACAVMGNCERSRCESRTEDNRIDDWRCEEYLIYRWQEAGR